MNEEFKNILFANLFAINVIFIYYLFKNDKYLELNKFYLLYNISKMKIYLSKLIILGIPLTLHFSLLFIVVLNVNFHLYITILSIIILFFLTKLIFLYVDNKLNEIIYFIIISALMFLSYIFSGVYTSLIIFFFLFCCFFINIKYNLNAEGELL